MAQKPGIPKGTRDFSPEVMVKRNYVMDTIKHAFQLYGYLPIETPAMENMDTLTGKYGDEGDRLIFKILNSGDFLSKANISENTTSQGLTPKIVEKALRYDLTVPFARYVVQHQNEITFPFKRYQIQPVWRADRPQKGRFREFYQCDADVVGSDSLIQELELIQLYDEVFAKLGLSVTIKLNNRKLLAGIAEVIREEDKLIDFTVALDKLDKIGAEKVQQEMLDRGLSAEAVKAIEPLLSLSGSNTDKLNTIRELLSKSDIGTKGVEEVAYILDLVDNNPLQKAKLELDLTLARGLNYYTGAIFEVVSDDVQLGSVGGGGRYDDLTGIFGLKNISGVGISFGLDRIYLVLEELGLFPNLANTSTQVLFVNFGEKETNYCLKLLTKLRVNNINAELYPDKAKLGKQFTYADNKSIPYVVVVGAEEIQTGQLAVKEMATGEQNKMTIEDFITLQKQNA